MQDLAQNQEFIGNPTAISPDEEMIAVSLPTLTDEERRLGNAIIDPKLFAEVFLDSQIWDTQAKIFEAVRDEERVAVKACHASSKTFSAAVLALWFLARHTDEAVVVTTAPSWNQVERLLWGEIHSALLRSRFPFPKPLKTQLNIGPKRFAYGISTVVTNQDEGVKFQGIHAKHVLVIIDEAPGVDAKIWQAIESARAGGNTRVLAIGNPTIASGPFHDAFVNNRSGWKTFTIDAFNTPNFKGISLDDLLKFEKESPEKLQENPCPYLITRKWVVDQYHTWGVDHPFWESRVRGNFPKQSPDALLSLAWLEEASRRELAETGDCEAGLDVAGPGEDETSLTIRGGPKILLHKQWTDQDPRGQVVMELNPFKGRLKSIKVDCIGIGWNMYTHIKDIFGEIVQPVNVCETAHDSEKFFDQKSEYYWGLRQRIEKGDFCGLTDDKTIGQLAGIRYKPTSRGQIQIESKQDALKRGVKSPDRAESVMLAFASRMLIYGALDYFKSLQQQATSSVKAAEQKKEQISDCPKCHASCVVITNGMYRCNQCGNTWALPGKKPFVPKLSRTELLKTMGRA